VLDGSSRRSRLAVFNNVVESSLGNIG